MVFVHGCFWHRHQGCRYCTTPASNIPFWESKFAQNEKRDARNESELLANGWRVGVVWECQLSGGNGAMIIGSVGHWLKSKRRFFESSKRPKSLAR